MVVSSGGEAHRNRRWPSTLARNTSGSLPSSVEHMPTQLPPAQVCQLCGHDDEVSVVPGGDHDNWLYVCAAHEVPYNWTVAIPSKSSSGREGVTAELGPLRRPFAVRSIGRCLGRARDRRVPLFKAESEGLPTGVDPTLRASSTGSPALLSLRVDCKGARTVAQ